MKKQQLTELKWFDILIITIIMFGQGIYNSTIQYLALSNNTVTLEENLTFTSMQNYQAFATQFIWLFIAFIYLLWRNFDYSIFIKKIKITKWLIFQIIFIFIASALLMDLYYIGSYSISNPVMPSMISLPSNIDFSLILYSLLNGFYEEVFFLGICLTINPKYLKWSFLYSLIIRCSFHTYQGLFNGIALGLIVGIVYYFLYKKFKPQNLLPFFLAHAIADMIGLSVIFYFYR